MADNYMDNLQMPDGEAYAVRDAEAREKIDELNDLIDEAKELINTLQNTQDRMQSTIASAQASITDNANAITQINSDLLDLTYQIGDTISIRNFDVCGIISSGCTELSVTIPLNKPFVGTPKFVPSQLYVRYGDETFISGKTDFSDITVVLATINGIGLRLSLFDYNTWYPDKNNLIVECNIFGTLSFT